LSDKNNASQFQVSEVDGHSRLTGKVSQKIFRYSIKTRLESKKLQYKVFFYKIDDDMNIKNFYNQGLYYLEL